MALMSQRAYARHRAEQGLPGTTHRAVQKAVESGRIKLTADGKIDSAAADRAWAANSNELHRRNPGQEEAAKERRSSAPKKNSKAPAEPAASKGPKGRKPSKAAPAQKPPPPPPPPLPPLPSPPRREAPPPVDAIPEPDEATPGMALAEAAALEKVWKAKLAELDYEERTGRLVDAEEVQATWVEVVTLSKTKLLALPSKIKARIPSITAADVAVIDELVREALEELAGAGDAFGEEADGE